MRIRDQMTYANVMSTIAAVGVIAGGSAYAASKIDTRDIANKAVTAKKLDSAAVTTSKLRSGAVTSAKLGDGAVQTRNLSPSATLAIAGVSVYDGKVRGWFNRASDATPILEHTEAGVYDLTIPGIAGGEIDFVRLLSSVTLAGEITTRWTASSAGDLHPVIHTYDSSGSPADRSFTYLVYLADQGQ